MGRKNLTVKTLENLKPEKVRQEILDALLPGLRHVLQPSGARSWAVRYRFQGQSRKLTLQVAPMDLAGARKAAADALRAVQEGQDPAYQKRLLRELPPERNGIDKVIDDFLKQHVDKNNRQSHAQETRRIFERTVKPKWKGRRLQDITRRDVIRLNDEVLERGGSIANNTFAAVRKFFNWCVDKARLEASPCVGVKRPAANRHRDRVLTAEEIKQVWQFCDNDKSLLASVVKLLLLTGQRRDEVAEMRWSEVDLEKRLWTIPRERVKNDNGHEVPLSVEAVAVLEKLSPVKGKRKRKGKKLDLVFTKTGDTPVSGFSRFKDRLDRAMPVGTQHWVLHDIRRTVATELAKLGTSLPVIERILNHTSGSFKGVVGVYNKHKFDAEKAAALQLWGEHVSELVRRPEGSNVVQLKKKAPER